MADPRNHCWTCPDATRRERGCVHGLRDGTPVPGPTTCPVSLEVPPWWADVLDLAGSMSRGSVGPGHVTAYAWHLAQAVQAAQADAERAQTEARDKLRRQINEANRLAAAGGAG